MTSSQNFYLIKVGTSTSTIQTLINNAPKGATIHFEEGQHIITQPLLVSRSDITISGEGTGKTTLLLDIAQDYSKGIEFRGSVDKNFSTTLSEDVKIYSKMIEVKDASKIKAGDVLLVNQENDAEFLASGLYDNVKDSPYMKQSPLRESMVEVERVEGNKVYLKHEIAYDMQGGRADVSRINVLENIALSGMTITTKLGTPDPFDFTNKIPELSENIMVQFRYTQGAEVNDLAIVNAPSQGLKFLMALEPHVDGYTASGAWNKGSNGNGYALHLADTFYGEFEHLSVYDTRHTVVFASWHAEFRNNIQIDFSNRDINWHGSDDHDNVVIVDKEIYSGVNKKAWSVVDAYGEMHPITDLTKNTTLFKYVIGGPRADEVTGWDGGAIMYGMRSNDTLIGGAGNDIIGGGTENDTLTGRGGRDLFLVEANEGGDIITDFKTGGKGDLLLLNGFNGVSSLSNLKLIQDGSDTLVQYVQSGKTVQIVKLLNTKAGDVSEDNLAFNQTVEKAFERLDQLPSVPEEPEEPEIPEDPSEPLSGKLAGLAAKIGLGTADNLETFKVLDSTPVFNSAQYVAALKNVDKLDFAAAKNGAKILLGDALLSGTDAGKLTIAHGKANITSLDVSNVSDEYAVYVEGTGTVNLQNGGRVYTSAETQGKILGDSAEDNFRIKGGAAILNGGAGNDAFTIDQNSSNTMQGGAGNDVYYLSKNTLNGTAKIDGGEGRDSLQLSSAINLSTADLAHVSNIEHLRVTADGAKIALTNGLFSNGQLEVEGKSGVDLTLDATGLSGTGKTLVMLKDVNLTVTGTHSGTMNYAIDESAKGLLQTGSGADSVTGSDKGDRISTGAGNDKITSGKGNDTIDGGAGNDTITGGVSADWLTGGAGDDVFVFTSASDRGDTITDFGNGKDTINMSALFTAKMTVENAIAKGYLTMHEMSAGVVVGFDKDGKDGASASVDIVTLKDAELHDIDIHSIHTM